MSEPYEECPRFSRCDINCCPLDPAYPGQISLTGERRCPQAKAIRYRIGLKYPNLLRYQGLTAREWAGKQRWEALPEEEKQRIRQRSRERLKTA